MIICAPQESITWANALMHFPWPIQLNNFPPYAERLGWKPTSLPDEFSLCPDNDDEITILSSDREGNVRNLFLRAAANEAKNTTGAVELNDHFVSCVAAGREAWGEPFLLEAGDGPSVMWRFPGDMFAQVTSGRWSVLFNFFTPEGRRQFL